MNAPALPLDLGPPERRPRRQAPPSADLGFVEPGITGSGFASPGIAGSGATDPGTMDAQITNPGPASPDAANPGVDGPGVDGPGASRPAASEPVPRPDAGTAAVAPEIAGPAAYSPARLAARRFVGACLEVVGGFRPVTHLRPLCRPDRFAIVAERLTGRTAITAAGRAVGGAHFTARTPVVGRFGTGRPPRSGRIGQSAPGDRVSVQRVQLCEPLAGVAEVAVVLARREQVWAMALRLEHRSGRWLCSHLEIL